MHTLCNDWDLSSFNWSTFKNQQLIDDRGISFERVVSVKEKLSPEEREILDRFERGRVAAGGPDAERELEVARQAARRTFNKTRRVNLRVTERDFELAHYRAREEGIPYQTLLSSVIHRYLSGRLVERRRRRTGERAFSRHVPRAGSSSARASAMAAEADHLDAAGLRVALVTGIDDERPLRLQNRPLRSAGPFRPWGGGAPLDLDCPEPIGRQLEQQIDLHARRRAVEAGPRPRRSRADERLQHETLPACAGDGVTEHAVLVVESQQPMHEARCRARIPSAT